MRWLLLLTISLAGCASEPVQPPAKTVTVASVQKLDCGTVPARTAPEFRPITWHVLPDENGESVFSLTPKGYENLSFNMSEIEQIIRELKAEIKFYEECINE